MLTEKANAICLLEVLKEYSDAEHILPMREIITKMQSLHVDLLQYRPLHPARAGVAAGTAAIPTRRGGRLALSGRASRLCGIS